tara:strand:+ start:235712 stop:236872 length:1161 start_codon:yes stop_codon:yes gene_type:complete
MKIASPILPDSSFESQLDGFAESLAVDPDASPQSLLKRFPQCREQINQLVHASKSVDSSARLWDIPLPRQTDSHRMPDRIGRYRIVDRLGSGGMGNVYPARFSEGPSKDHASSVPKDCALKVIRPDLPQSKFVARFRKEQQFLRQARHRCLVKFIDAGSTKDNVPFLAMEWVQGTTIDSHCQDHAVSLGAMLDLLIDVCDGVAALHRQGILHRDLKPANILVHRRGKNFRPKIIDFGLAKRSDGQETLAASSSWSTHLLGTPHYMSPEQAALRCDRIGVRSDVFSLGILLYELLTGTTPLADQLSSGLSLHERLAMIRQQPPAALANDLHHSNLTSLYPIDSLALLTLDQICRKATQTDPNERYAGANAFANALRSFRSRIPVTPT